MLDRLKAPKRITTKGGDGGAEADGGGIAPVGGGGGVASAWNRAGTTWEDKDVTKWATGRLTELLGAARAETDADDSRGGSASPLPDLPPPPPPDCAPPLLGAPDRPFPLRAAVCSVKSCDGTATITSSRGVLRHALDYCFKLEWEITAQGDEAQSFKGLAHTETYSGTLAYTDVTSPTQLELQVLFGEAGDSGSARVSAGAISWRCCSWWGPILGGRGWWRGSAGQAAPARDPDTQPRPCTLCAPLPCLHRMFLRRFCTSLLAGPPLYFPAGLPPRPCLFASPPSPTPPPPQVSYAAGKTPSALVAPRVSQALDALKAQINDALDGFMDEFKRKGMH